MKKNHYPVFGIFFIAMLCSSGFGGILLLQNYFISIGASVPDIGYVLLASATGTFAGVPLAGRLSAKIPNPLTAIIGILFTAVGFAVFYFLAAFSILSFIAGLFIGFGTGIVTVSAPLTLSERTDNSGRVFWFTLYTAFLFCGFGLGVVFLRVLVSHWGFTPERAFAVSTLSCLLSAGLMAVFMILSPALNPQHKKNPAFIKVFIQLVRSDALYPLALIFFSTCIFTVYMTYQTSFGCFYGYNPALFLLIYGVSTVVTRLVTARFLNKFRPAVTLAVLFTCLALGTVSAILQSILPELYIVTAVMLALGYGLSYPVILAEVVNSSPPALKDPAVTWALFLYYTGFFGFPLIAGYILVYFKAPALWVTCLIIAVLMLFMLLLKKSKALKMQID